MQHIINQFKNKKIVVFGDYYLDEFIHTESKEYSPEAPVPRAIVREIKRNPGAAGNVAFGFGAYGTKVFAVGIIGEDNEGYVLKELLQNNGVNTNTILVDKDRLTGTFSRILLAGNGNIKQHVIRIDRENTTKVSESYFVKLKEIVTKIIKDCDAVFIADYNEAGDVGVVCDDMLACICSIARKEGKLLLGTSRLYINKFIDFDIVIMNKSEAEKIVGFTISDEEILQKAGIIIQKQLRATTVIITLGKDGMYAIREKEKVRLPTFVKNLVDVSGAGDTFAVTFLLSTLCEATLSDSSTLANHAVAVSVGKEGTAAVSSEELGIELFGNTKILDPEKINFLLDKKRKGKKVIFTNGYFDFIHAGQIRFLEEAKEQGDILIVGINNDESTRANKGQNRPLQNQYDRAKILSAFTFVDYVTIFDDLTPIKIIKKIRPDVIVKGGDYTNDEVMGKDIVETYGGKIIVLPLRGPPTDEFIEHIKKSTKTVHGVHEES